MTELQLLDKTEIWIYGVTLDAVNLPRVAQAAAAVLSIPGEKVFVTDVRESHIVLDILKPNVFLQDIAGKEKTLLAAIAAIDGVALAADARIHSEGVLGLIGAQQENVPDILSEAARMEANIAAYCARRVAVVSTGFELLGGNIRDTNLEAVQEYFGGAGYEVESGGVVADDLQAIAGRVSRLAGEFGIVITTGGVGAENKDFTIEAFEYLDANLQTAVLARYKAGHGRHVKSEVRIALASIGDSIALALPGPTHEVKLALPVFLEGLRAQIPPAQLIENIASVLRSTLPSGHAGSGHH